MSNKVKYAIRVATSEDALSIAYVHHNSRQLAYRSILLEELLNAQSLADREKFWAGQIAREPLDDTEILVAENVNTPGPVGVEASSVHGIKASNSRVNSRQHGIPASPNTGPLWIWNMTVRNLLFVLFQATLFISATAPACGEPHPVRVPGRAPVKNATLQKAAVSLRCAQYKKTIALCDQVLRTAPNNFDAYLLRSEADLMENDRYGAVADASRAIKINPDYLAPYVIQSQTLLFAETHELGIAECTELSAKEPDSAAPFLYRALFCLLTGKSRDALLHLDKALSLKPPPGLRAWICGAKFSAYKSLNERPEGLPWLRQAQSGLARQLELTPEDLSPRYIRGVLAHFSDTNTSDFKKILESNPGPLLRYLATHSTAAQEIERKHYAAAEKLLEKNIALWPIHPSAYGLLAGCQTSNGRPDKAALTMGRIMMLNPVLAVTYVQRMGYYHKIGKLPSFQYSATPSASIAPSVPPVPSQRKSPPAPPFK